MFDLSATAVNLVGELLFKLMFLVVAVLAGAIFVMSPFSGKSIDVMPWRRPVLVQRSAKPREYWAGVWFAFLAFALTV